MGKQSDFGLDAIVRKLDRLSRLDDLDRRAIASLPFIIAEARANHLLVREGDRPDQCCFLLSGFACRHKASSNGNRQIVSFHLPGDILDLQHLLLRRADHNIETVTPATFAWVPSQTLMDLSRQRPAIADALWRDTLIDASIFREWVLNVGQRDAKARIAHMLCEFAVRRAEAGLGNPERFDLPMSQEQIADATGLTSVHVNRMLRALDEEGVIERQRRLIAITDWDRMREIADFDPTYLHAEA